MGAAASTRMKALGEFTPRRLRQLWYVPVLAAATGLMMVRLLVLARLLDVTVFAVLGLALLVSSTVGMVACFGLQSLLQRDMPVMFVRGREQAARVLLGQSLLAAYAVAALAVPLALLWSPPGRAEAGAVVLGVLHGLAQQLFVLATVESRSRGEPLRFALQSLARSFGVVACGLAVAAGTGSAEWVVLAEAAVSLLLAHQLVARTFAGARAGLPGTLALAVRRRARLDWRAALTLLLVSLVGFLVANADRWAAAASLDLSDFGAYAFAGTLLTMGVALQAMLNASVYPMLARLHAREGAAACFSLAARLSLGLLGAALVASVPLYFLCAKAIRAWYPAYAPAIDLLPPFLFVASLRVSDFWSSYLMIVGLHDRLLRVNVAAGAVAALAWAAAVRPWQSAPDAADFAALLALLGLVTYAAVAAACWRGAPRRERA